MMEFVMAGKRNAAFLRQAKKLGCSLCFVYTQPSGQAKESKSQRHPSALLSDDYSSQACSFDFAIVDSSRHIEKKSKIRKPFIMINMEKASLSGSLKHICSGMNLAVAKDMKKTGKIYGINTRLFCSENPLQGLVFRRVKQNIFLCRKLKIPFALISLCEHPFQMRSEQDYASFLSLFGISEEEASNCLSLFETR